MTYIAYLGFPGIGCRRPSLTSSAADFSGFHLALISSRRRSSSVQTSSPRFLHRDKPGNRSASICGQVLDLVLPHSAEDLAGSALQFADSHLGRKKTSLGRCGHLCGYVISCLRWLVKSRWRGQVAGRGLRRECPEIIARDNRRESFIRSWKGSNPRSIEPRAGDP